MAVTLAKQRLLTAVFDYYELAHPEEGIGSGFVYKTVPHVTLKSIANNPEIKPGMTRVEIDAAIARYADQETLYDQPKIDKQKVRVTGPFTVEAVPAVTIEPIESGEGLAAGNQGLVADSIPADNSVARHGRDWPAGRLARRTLARPASVAREVRISTSPAWNRCRRSDTCTPWAKRKPTSPQRVVVSFGPEHAPLEQRHVDQASTKPRSYDPSPTWYCSPRSTSIPKRPRTSTKQTGRG